MRPKVGHADAVAAAIQATLTLVAALALAPVLHRVNAAIHDAFAGASMAGEFQPHDARQDQADAAQPERIARFTK